MNSLSSAQSTPIQERESRVPVDGRVPHPGQHTVSKNFDVAAHHDKPSSAGLRTPDRRSYFWLVLATVLMPFTIFRWTIPLAAWLAPVFLLRFVRTQPLIRGILLALLANVLVLEFVLRGVMPIPDPFYYPAVFGVGVAITLPYLIDRVVASRLGGLLGTMVFPAAMSTWWYVQASSAVINPYASTWMNPAYTQSGNLPLLQLLSVTGLWGIVFLMSWFASLINWAWEQGFAWPRVRGGALLYAGLLATVLLFGGMRLGLFPAQGSAVRVAGISPSRTLPEWETVAHSAFATQPDREHARQAFAEGMAPVYDDLFSRSQLEASAGAKIIAWPDGRTAVFEEDEPALLARASALTLTTGIYLDIGMSVILQHPVQLPTRVVLNQLALIDPTGNVVLRYEKFHLAPGPEAASNVQGDGRVPTVQTPYGLLSNLVCSDFDFPDTVRQAGEAGADIMLVPAHEWPEIVPMHSQIATFRAIENGFSLVRPAAIGLATAVDYEGNVLAASDYNATDQQVIVAYVPTQGVRTIYATIGDVFAWLSAAGLLVLVGMAVARARRGGGTGLGR
jgi:apolipoprotein N-acyltransferase